MFRTGGKRGSPRRSVCEDWINALPREKSQMFDLIVARWESVYAMMSVSLDNSLALRSRGDLVCSREQVRVTVELFDRVASSLIAYCQIVDVYARLLPNCPAVQPLNTKFFRGNIGQSAASWNNLLHRLLFGDRSRFHHKIRIMSETLTQLDREFKTTASSICTAGALEPAEAWNMLDCIHYDFNTCLRESEVLLKSFLRALPAQHLNAFGASMDAQVSSRALGVQPRLSGASA